MIALTEAVSALQTWLEMLQLSFPYLVASAGVGGLALAITPEVVWQVPLAMLPVMAGIFLSYRRYFAVASAAGETGREVQSGHLAAEAHA